MAFLYLRSRISQTSDFPPYSIPVFPNGNSKSWGSGSNLTDFIDDPESMRGGHSGVLTHEELNSLEWGDASEEDPNALASSEMSKIVRNANVESAWRECLMSKEVRQKLILIICAQPEAFIETGVCAYTGDIH